MRARLNNPPVASTATRSRATRSGWTRSRSSPDAQNVDEAYEFLDFIMAPENAAMISNFARYGNGIAGSEEFMDAEMRDAPEIVIPEEHRANGQFLPTCPASATDLYSPDLDRASELRAEPVARREGAASPTPPGGDPGTGSPWHEQVKTRLTTAGKTRHAAPDRAAPSRMADIALEPGQATVEVGPAVAEEPPAGAHLGAGVEVERRQHDLLPVPRPPRQHLARGAGDEGRAVEDHLAPALRLGADAVAMATTGMRFAAAWPRMTVSQCGWLS